MEKNFPVEFPACGGWRSETDFFSELDGKRRVRIEKNK
jgi:hypothetical protein